MRRRSSGILLDLYENINKGTNVFWILEPDGKRKQYFHQLPITFYIYSTNKNLRDAWKYLYKNHGRAQLSKQEKIHPFDGEIKPFLAVCTQSHTKNKQIAKSVQAFNPGLELYDVGHSLLLHYSAFHNVFMFCEIEFEYDDETHCITSFECKEDRWNLEYHIPALRIFNIKADINPKILSRSKPVTLAFESKSFEIDLVNEDKSFTTLYQSIKKFDPDIILSDFGDNMIFPFLLNQSYKKHVRNIFSRDHTMGIKVIKASSIESYGRVIHRKQQSLLFGRHHIDRKNMNFYTDLDIETIFEISRISGLHFQEAARTTPGRAVASMEVIEALKTGTCIPYKKQKPELWRHAENLLIGDRGGVIHQPLVGVHENVISADFDSMFPAIMVKKNLSPETMNKEDVPLGVIPRALGPLLERRLYYKKLAKVESNMQEIYKRRSDALKWLLVVSFGYTGFKNAPLSSPNIFEKINEWGRESLLETKEIFDEQGFESLHIFIDSIFVKHEKEIDTDKIQFLLNEVERRTELPISIECIYKWVVFLPSKMNRNYAIPNSYFGVFQDGTIKVRGIQCRRGDKPFFVKNAQIKILKILAEADNLLQINDYLQVVYRFVMKQVRLIKEEKIPIEELVVNQRLSKNLEDYKVFSHVAKAGLQLKKYDIDIRAGSKVKFIYVKGNPRVLAWDLVSETKQYKLDIKHYIYLFEDAVKTVLMPFGVEEDYIESLIKLIPAKQLSFIKKNKELRKFWLPSNGDYPHLLN